MLNISYAYEDFDATIEVVIRNMASRKKQRELIAKTDAYDDYNMDGGVINDMVANKGCHADTKGIVLVTIAFKG